METSSLKHYSEIVFQIIGAAMEVHKVLHSGLLEAVYQEALHLELQDRNLPSQREVCVKIEYKDHILDKEYRIDLLVEDIILELKSVSQLQPEHRSQLCNYLRLTKKPVGILINFGSDNLIAERWVFDVHTNRCYLVDRNMNAID